MPVYEIADFVKGKRTGRNITARDPERVTVVTGDVVDQFLGARSRDERDDHLRWLRERGTLISEPGRLMQRVRCDDGIARLRYFFRGPADAVPKIRKRPGVMTW
jgi:hypothetical protein